MRPGTISAPPAIPIVPGTTLFFAVQNTTNEDIDFDLTTELILTNNEGNFLTVLSNLNEHVGRFNPLATGSSAGPYYRYESGTSMGAAGISGMAALIEQFYNQLGINPSPALMKALLINGARQNSGLYDFGLTEPITYAGWGLPVLQNSAPGVLTNKTAGAPLQWVDQSPTNALATGQSTTWTINLTGGATNQPLRVNLVWTDPPGNPAAGIKLVNDLDLIMTNTGTGDVFYGNDIPDGSTFNESWDTNGPPNIDVINNVESIYISPPLGTNYTITVVGSRVNVNAVTANTNNVVQDFALVIGNGDAQASWEPGSP